MHKKLNDNFYWRRNINNQKELFKTEKTIGTSWRGKWRAFVRELNFEEKAIKSLVMPEQQIELITVNDKMQLNLASNIKELILLERPRVLSRFSKPVNLANPPKITHFKLILTAITKWEIFPFTIIAFSYRVIVFPSAIIILPSEIIIFSSEIVVFLYSIRIKELSYWA